MPARRGQILTGNVTAVIGGFARSNWASHVHEHLLEMRGVISEWYTRALPGVSTINIYSCHENF